MESFGSLSSDSLIDSNQHESHVIYASYAHSIPESTYVIKIRRFSTCIAVVNNNGAHQVQTLQSLASLHEERWQQGDLQSLQSEDNSVGRERD